MAGADRQDGARMPENGEDRVYAGLKQGTRLRGLASEFFQVESCRKYAGPAGQKRRGAGG